MRRIIQSKLERFFLNFKSLSALGRFQLREHFQQSSYVELSNRFLLVSLSQVNLVVLALFRTNHTDKVKAFELGSSHLLSKLVS